MCNGLHVKCLLFLSDFIATWVFSTYFRRTLKYQISSKSFQLGAELFRADRRTDEANSRFSQFCEYAWKLALHMFEDSFYTQQYR